MTSSSLITYCPVNSTFTPVWFQDGFSLCFFLTFQPIVMFLIPIFVLLFHKYLQWKQLKRCRKARKERKGLIQHEEGQNLDEEDPCIVRNKRCFKDFPFSSLPVPFLYACQIFLHLIHMFIPVLHLTLKLILDRNHVAGVDILYACLNVCAWLLGFHSFKKERYTFYILKFCRHSVPMFTFWGMSLILEVLVFTSWNSPSWFLKEHNDTADVIDLSMFCIRFIASISLLILGIHAPGLKQPLYVDANENEEKKKDKLSPLVDLWEKSKKLWPFIWPNNPWLRVRVIVCITLLISGRVINVFVPAQYKKIINYFTYGHHTENPWLLIFLYMLYMFLQGGGGIGSMGLLNNIRSFLWIKVQQYTSRSIQVELFEHLHNLSLRWHLQRKTGEVIRMVDRGSTSIENLLSYILFQIAPTVADIIVAIVYFGLAFNGWFALIVFVTMFLYVLATVVVTEWRTKYRRDMNLKENATKAVAVDSLLNFETVKYYNNERYEVKRYNEKIEDFQDSQWFIQMSLNVLNTAQNIVITGGMFTGMMYCGSLVARGDLSVGDFVLFITYMRQLYMPLNFFGTYYRLIQAAFIDMENMFDLLDEQVEVVDAESATVLRLSRGLVEFKDVKFSYDERKPVLRGISFTVLPGQTIALVGPSGSGKSTIIRLMFRFYDVENGTIYLDGQDIKKVTQRSLRQNIGVVPQDTVLFNETIKYNISYGRVGSSTAQVIDAAESADIHAKIHGFPDQYETMVGERGLKLSGGEKQRVAIARTLLKAPEIVLLDEATSALDTQTERNIQSSLNRVCANKTTIVVAHRLSTIIGADQILVLKNGVIVERGRHQELLEMKGLYSGMWNQQLEEVDDE